MSQTTPTVPQRQLYGRWTRPRSAGLLGMTFGTTLIVLLSFAIVFIAFMVLGWPAGLIPLAVLTVINIPLVWSRDGRSGWERGIEMWQWRKVRKNGEHLYRGGRFSTIPGGGARLPGILAGSKMYEDEAAGGQRFGMLHLPKDHYAIVLRARAQGGEWVDQRVIDRWVNLWGNALATIGQPADIAGVTATVETLPTTGQELQAEVKRLRTDNGDIPELVQSVMQQTTGMSRAAVSIHGRCAVVFRGETGRRRRAEDQAAEIARQLPNLLSHFDAAGLPCEPMTAADIAALTRRAYTISDYPEIERCEILGEPHGVTWPTAGPIGCKEESDEYLHDGARSITWEMDTAPAGAVDERVLTALLGPARDAPRKRVTIVYRVHDAADAVKISDDDYKDAIVAHQTQRGVGSAEASLRVESTGASRTEQARGAGLARFGLLVTVTAPEDADMPRLATLTKGLSEASRLQIRRCYRYQAAAFAGSLGVGLLLPEHESIMDILAG